MNNREVRRAPHRMNDEQDRIESLEAETWELKSALAQAQLRVLVLGLMIDIAEKHYNIDIKKDCGGKQLNFYGNQSPSVISMAKEEQKMDVCQCEMEDRYAENCGS